jgi:hypothetical protein
MSKKEFLVELNAKLERLHCKYFGHKYTLLREITPTIRELKCTRCGLEFGMNDETKSLLLMDGELRELQQPK